MQYDNTNSGAIFPAREKKTEKHPDMTGSLNVDGVEYYVSGWTKVSQKGQKFLSLSVKAKQEVAQKTVQQTRQAVMDDFEDNDLPF